MNEPFEVFAWVSVDPSTNAESLCAVMSEEGHPFQAISNDKETIAMMRAYFVDLAKQSKKQFKLVKFGSAETVEAL